MSDTPDDWILRWKEIMTRVQDSVAGEKNVSFEELNMRYSKLADRLQVFVNRFSYYFTEDIQRRMVVRKSGAVFLRPMRASLRGAFLPLDSSLIFGIFFNRIIPSVKHHAVDVYVLCGGYAYNEKVYFWQGGDSREDKKRKINELFSVIVTSDDFKSIPTPDKITEGQRVRTFVWLSRERHAFGVVWDMFLSGEQRQLEIYQINSCVYDPYGIDVVDIFRDRLCRMFSMNPQGGGLTLIPNRIVETADNFPCVPFLARSTLYMSMLENLSDKQTLQKIAHTVKCFTDGGSNTECTAAERLYVLYELKLLRLAENVFRIRKQILVCPLETMNQNFVNINRFYLESIGVGNRIPSRRYVFNGFEDGFVRLRADGTVCASEACTFMSRVPAAISAVRECILLIRTLQNSFPPSIPSSNTL